MKRHRSPAYPAVSLKAAIEKAQMLYGRDGRSKIPVGVATQHLGYTVGSGLGQRTIAALRHFSLLGATGRKDSRLVWLSELALDIVHEHDAERRRSAIRIAALSPEIHGDVWDVFKGQLPSDDVLQAYLVRDREFNDAHVRKVIEVIRATFTFANLVNSNAVNQSQTTADTKGQAAVGQSADDRQDGGPTNYREGSTRQAGTKEAVYPLANGDAVLQWPDSISPDEAEDLDDWLDLMKRKLKRSITAS